jgi:hypothetical protein
MAQAPRQHGGDGAADFIRQIVSDPKNVPDVALLTGYLGASSEEGHERLYLSPDLTNYVEIPKDAILHQAPLPSEQDAHGGVTLWVKKDAALQYKMAPAAQALANYFAGAIQAGAQGAAPVAQPLQPATFAQAGCPVTLPNVCRVTLVHSCGVDCTVVGPACRLPTQRTPCAAASCGIDCSVIGPACQSHFHTCAPCVTQNRTPCPAATCGIDCTVVGPACGSRFHTCAPCVTQNRTPCPAVSCGIDCTVVGPACQSIHVGTCFVQCNPTRFQPQCPFPTEVTCVPVCAASPAPACGPNTIGGCSAACFPGQFPGQPGPVAQAAAAPQAAFAAQANLRPSFVDCSIICPTRIGACLSHHFTCAPCRTQHPLQCTFGCTQPPQCVLETVNPHCQVTLNVLQCSIVCTQPGQCLQSVNPQCVTRNLEQCSLVCPTVFATCVTCNPAFCQIGPGPVEPGGPVEQLQAFSLANCSMAFCTQVPVVCNPTQVTPCAM